MTIIANVALYIVPFLVLFTLHYPEPGEEG